MRERKGCLLSRFEDIFNPKLTQREIDRRKQAASRITLMLCNHTDYSPHIREAYLYGSLVYGEPRADADVDVALITISKSVWNDDPEGCYLLINGVFHQFREKLRIPYFKVDCAICPENLFNHPENEPDERNRQLYLDVKNKGIKIF